MPLKTSLLDQPVVQADRGRAGRDWSSSLRYGRVVNSSGSPLWPTGGCEGKTETEEHPWTEAGWLEFSNADCGRCKADNGQEQVCNKQYP